jgi:hypothetical protein
VGTIPLVPSAGIRLKALPLHIDEAIGVTAATGFTVTVTFCILVHVAAVKV